MKKKKKKQITIYLLSILTLLLIIITIISYPCITNDKYSQKLIKNIYNNTNIKNIEYINKSNNYYIIKDKQNIIVLDLNYDIVKKQSKEEITPSNLNIVYRRGNIYYEEKIKEKNSLIYKYYNVNDNTYAFEIKVGEK